MVKAVAKAQHSLSGHKHRAIRDTLPVVEVKGR